MADGTGFGIFDPDTGLPITKLEGDGDAKLGNSTDDVIQITGSIEMNENIFLTNNGRIGIGDSDPSYKLSVGGSMAVGEYIYHKGDANTFIRFQDDSVNLQAGGVDFITLTEAAQDEVVINESSADIDFRVESNHVENMFFVLGSDNRIGIGTNSPQHTLDIQERAGVEAVIRLVGSADVGIRLAADSDNSGENDNPYIDFYQDGLNSNSRPQRLATMGMEGDAGATFTDSLANTFFLDAAYPAQLGTSTLRTLQLANDSKDNGHAARITLEGNNGYVGIHTNAAAHPLTVNGDTSITGTLMITNPLTASAFYSFPTAEGTANQVLAATGIGGLIFSDLATLMPQCMTIAVTEENTDIQTGTAQVTIRSPYSIGITDVRGSLSTASTGATPVEFDVNVDGTSIFTTEPTFDPNETTTQTAATAGVLSGSVAMVGDDSVITIDVDAAGTGARGLKVTLYYTRMS